MATALDVNTEGSLRTERISEGNITCVRFDGVIDETFEGKRLALSIKAKTVVLDMGRIEKISSFGIREWFNLMEWLARTAEAIYLIECTTKVVDQINMVSGFLGKSRVISFYAPYRCDYCDIDSNLLYQVDQDGAAIRSLEPKELACGTCSRPQFFDEDPNDFFATIARQPGFDLGPGVADFLSAKLNYNVSGGNRRLQIDKYVEGRYTFVRVSGNLDGAFSSDKIAEGLEGAIVLDVSGLGSVDLAGAAEWRNFIALTRESAERIYLLGCPPTLVQQLQIEDLGDEVLSLSLPYHCNSCSTTTSETIEVADHIEILKFATPPEMRCSSCKQATTCAAEESLLSRFIGLSKPTADSKLRAFVKAARSRKPERVDAVTGGSGGVASKKLMAAVSVSIAGVLAASGFMIYRATQQDDAQSKLDEASKRIEELVAKRAFDRPTWITSSTRFSGYCVDRIGTMTCVGISSYKATLEEAKVEARDVALEEVASALAIKTQSELFDNKIRPMYSDARQAALTAYDSLVTADTNSADYQGAYERLVSARHRAANALMASSNDAMPSQPSELYWEKYDEGKGAEFVVYTRFDINDDAVSAMGKIFTQEREVGGGMAITASPLLAWSYQDFVGGVVVTEARGQLKDAGPLGVVVGVDDKSVASVTDLVGALASGGKLTLASAP